MLRLQRLQALHPDGAQVGVEDQDAAAKGDAYIAIGVGQELSKLLILGRSITEASPSVMEGCLARAAAGMLQGIDSEVWT